MHDLENNMDITRLNRVTINEQDICRMRKYKKAYNRLWTVWKANKMNCIEEE